MSTLTILSKHSGELLAGLLVTLQLCAVVWTVSLGVGGALAVLSARFPRAVGYPTTIFSLLLSGVPIIVLLFWLHYPAQALAEVVVRPFITAAVALSVTGVFMVADAVRAVLGAFPSQYVTAAKVCGLSERQILVHIKLPIIARSLAPALILVGVGLFQATLFASFISVDEIFRVTQRINSVTYRPVEAFSALAAFCVAVCVPFILLSRSLARRYSRDLSER